jgi:hypothetical protein
MIIDVTSPKVLVPTILFAALQFVPLGLVPRALMVSLGIFVLTKYLLKRTFTPADIVVPAILFMILSPGVLLTLPPGATPIEADAVHTIVFGIVFATLRIVFPKYY